MARKVLWTSSYFGSQRARRCVHKYAFTCSLGATIPAPSPQSEPESAATEPEPTAVDPEPEKMDAEPQVARIYLRRGKLNSHFIVSACMDFHIFSKNVKFLIILLIYNTVQHPGATPAL